MQERRGKVTAERLLGEVESRRAFASFQICRAAAALSVVLFHIGGTVALGKYFGATQFDTPAPLARGVDFFIALSGFIITWVHGGDFGKPHRLPSYLWRRSVRIYPIYWLVFLAVLMVALLTPALRDAAPDHLSIVLKSMVLLPQDPAQVGGTGAPVLVVAWSLQYEIAFYAIVALAIINRLLGCVALAVFCINFVTCQLGTCSFPRSFFSSGLFLIFGLGALSAWLCRSSMTLPRPLLVAAVGGGGLVLAAVLEMMAPQPRYPTGLTLLYGLSSAVLLLGAARAEIGGQLRLHRGWACLLGDASYSLYLLHFPLISALCKLSVWLGLSGVAGAAITAPFILVTCVFAAVACHLYVEKPLLQRARNLPALCIWQGGRNDRKEAARHPT